MFISGKCNLTGEIEIPEKGDPKYRLWKSDNNMIMSWLINSMNNDIGENFLLYGTTKEIWDAAKETYSSSENTVELFQIETILHDFRQENLIVTQPWCDHYRKSGLWKESCWKLHGKLADWKPNKPNRDKENRANAASSTEEKTSSETSGFSKEQMEILQKMICNSLSQSTSQLQATSMKAQRSSFPVALNTISDQGESWIVDSGASDHMTGDATLLHNYCPQTGNGIGEDDWQC
ncbi:uncharacterized protein LOC102623150 [Citrus sinensis]|uniref:uncharacterized protein LOC102623150 n=1 Tax=Citrus sinensis TaxID=2711 RepID=UPI0022794048|nr:uncharacterized protein LOC102623150 [Citrus sinensis]